MTSTPVKMTYRFLCNSGLLVSQLALGAWMFKDGKYTVNAWYDMMEVAYKHGINMFDTAEIYGNGHAEENMGGVIKKGVCSGLRPVA
ncbi:unnamed protein product [Phytophthora lilii]|uniref:Unnamed protein product n=1 Tax=Phytophthora lilii TaxID=2077276 RepID=A0A9W6TJV7_9STRA|nr:unnamed protein product [Phytophthora lilii]